MSIEGNGSNITRVVVNGSDVDKVVANGGVNWRRSDVVNITSATTGGGLTTYGWGQSPSAISQGSATDRVINTSYTVCAAVYFSGFFIIHLVGDQTGVTPFYSVHPSSDSELLRSDANISYSGGVTIYTWTGKTPSGNWSATGAVTATFRYIA